MRRYTKIPAITGEQLIVLLVKDGWENGGKSTHGISLFKFIDGKNIVTTVKNTSENIPEGTLGSILGVKQTRIGKRGLLDLVNKYGLE
ncbi:MAG: hypothetical protein PHE50_09180 [Dehalococcoidales bacterium]|nr:hypothetical protein [Dehalococcoidales bacterium]